MTSQNKIVAAIDTAEVFKQPGETASDAVMRLAELPHVEYDRVRRNEAKQLGIRVSVLDLEVQKARCSHGGAKPTQGLFITEIEPWPVPVEGAALLDDLVNALNAHLVVPTGCAEAMALWVLFAHAHDCFDISPILALTSPTPECGKTTALTALQALVPRACSTSNITMAAVFRAVDKWQPTLLIDEADTFLHNADELRGVLDSGHRRAAAYVVRTVGDDHEPRLFHTWAPKAIAKIGSLPPTLASRSIHVELKRKLMTENVLSLRGERVDALKELGRKAARWTLDHAPQLESHDAFLPTLLSNRGADNWRPLLGIAECAGGEWPARAREVAVSMSAKGHSEVLGIMILEDIRTIFQSEQVDRLISAQLAGTLAAMDNRPWSEWRNGSPITPNQVAKLLEPFGVSSNTIRIKNITAKGYKRVDFEDTFARYLSKAAVTR